MQEHTQWYESTPDLTRLSPRRPGKGLSRTIQKGIALKPQSLAVRWHCAVEWLAVNLVSKLPRPLGKSLRRLVYPLFAHTGKGLHVRARHTQASQPFSRTQTQTDPGTARSLYENCLRGYLKDTV